MSFKNIGINGSVLVVVKPTTPQHPFGIAGKSDSQETFQQFWRWGGGGGGGDSPIRELPKKHKKKE